VTQAPHVAALCGCRHLFIQAIKIGKASKIANPIMATRNASDTYFFNASPLARDDPRIA
jgi:hypothetical protein